MTEIKKRIKLILDLGENQPLPYELHFLYDNHPDKIKGKNLFKLILSVARKWVSNPDINFIKRNFLKYLPPNFETNYFIIAQDGTIKLNKKIYDTYHQQMYPKTIPGIAIKAFWTPESITKEIFKNKAIEQASLGIKILPFEINELNSTIQKAQKWAVAYKDQGKLNIEHIAGMLENNDKMNYFNQNGIIKDLKEFYRKDEIEQAYDYIDNLEPVEIGEIFGIENWLKFDTKTIPVSEAKFVYVNKNIQ